MGFRLGVRRIDEDQRRNSTAPWSLCQRRLVLTGAVGAARWTTARQRHVDDGVGRERGEGVADHYENDYRFHPGRKVDVIVCVCEAISERRVKEQFARGACTVEAMGQACGAGQDCGECRPVLQRMLQRLSQKDPAPCAVEIAAK